MPVRAFDGAVELHGHELRAAVGDRGRGRKHRSPNVGNMSAYPDDRDVQTFLEWERRQPERHEFSAGRTLAFAGGTLGHSALAAGLIARIQPHVRPCRTHASDALIVTKRSARYADVLVTCDERDAAGEQTVRYPKLIIEVLSESTAAIDRGDKFDEYTTIDSLEEYVLIDSARRWARSYRRSGTAWTTTLPFTSGSIDLPSIELAISLDELYEEAGL